MRSSFPFPDYGNKVEHPFQIQRISNNFVSCPVLKVCMKLASRVFKIRDLIRTQVSKAWVCCFGNSLRGQICHVEPRKIEFIRLELCPPLKHKSTTLSNGTLQNPQSSNT